ncbi:MAG: hypothetical protein Pg6A_13190 [Termitinemataceae bacterium]|nr:MAG: hypothetical protein Pg6A_13190 [Termitinemataceae bacterium]
MLTTIFLTNPDKSVDMIFADPPYNLSVAGFLTVKNGKPVACDKGKWDNRPLSKPLRNKIKVINSGNQIETQSKTFTAAAVFVRNNPKPLDSSCHIPV